MGWDANALIDSAKNYASDMTNNMVTVGNNATAAMNGLTLPAMDFNAPWVQSYSVVGAAPASPLIPAILATPVTAPTLGTITVPTFDAAPVFTLAAPVLNLPATPDATLPGAPGGAPAFNAPTLPSAPTVSLPTAPTLQALQLPVMPTITVPTFTSTLPVEDITEPTTLFSYAEQPYQSALLDGLKAKLLNDLMNGGYGIEAADELGLWQREADRETRLGEQAVQDAARQVAARGFSMPPGALNAFMDQARQTAMEKLSGASRDIALKRADLYVENRKFTIDQVRQAEQMLITYTGYMMERMLNAAKANVELGISVYNARMAKLQYHLDKYRAQAQVYDTVLKAAMANLEVYKEQVEGAKLSVEAQRVYAEVYRTQIDGVNALFGMYSTQMQAAKVGAEIEQLKLQAFKTTVETYTAQVGAKQAQFGMYEAQVRGEMSKVQAFQAQVGAYGTQVDAYKGKVQAAHAVLEAQIEPAKLQVEKYRADISRYGADIQAAQTTIQATLGRYSADIQGFTATMGVIEKNAEIFVSTSKANADIAIATAKQQGDIAVASSNIAAHVAGAFASTQSSLAGTYGSAAAAALQTASGIVATVSSA